MVSSKILIRSGMLLWGGALLLTMIINVIVPHAVILLNLWLVQPFLRWRSGSTAVTQQALNDVWRGVRFEVEKRYPIALNTLFICFVYSGGLPLLLPIGSIAFTLFYWLEKTCMLRLYTRPPQLDNSIANYTVSVLRFALMLHCLFSGWMYGSPEMISGNVDPTVIAAGTGGGISHEAAMAMYQSWVASVRSWDFVGLVPKLLRANAFPMFFLFVVLFVIFVLKDFLISVISRVVTLASCGVGFDGFYRILKWMFKPIGRAWRHFSEAMHRNLHIPIKPRMPHVAHVSGVPQRKYLPPFTEEFHQEIPPWGKEVKLSPLETKQGWRLKDVNQVQTLSKVWLSGMHTDVNIFEDVTMRTWEVMQQAGLLHTYDIRANNNYRSALDATNI